MTKITKREEELIQDALSSIRANLNEEGELRLTDFTTNFAGDQKTTLEASRDVLHQAVDEGQVELSSTSQSNLVTPKVAPRQAASWDETFMKMAVVVANRSKDPSTQVGACIVSADNRILSLGYNGTPNGWDDNEFPWTKVADDELDTKYPYVIHAERNAVLNYSGLNSQLRGAKIFVTHFPCNESAKELAQVGVSELIYLNSHDSSNFSTQASLRILESCGISVRQLSL